MKLLFESLERHGIGTRALNEDDFWGIAEIESIKIIYSDDKFPFSFTLMGRKFLVLPKCRKGLKLLFSMFHELGHLLLMNGSEPAVAFQGLTQCDNDKAEAEADAIALIALIPKHKMMEMAAEFGQTRYGDKLWRERSRLYFLYDI